MIWTCPRCDISIDVPRGGEDGGPDLLITGHCHHAGCDASFCPNCGPDERDICNWCGLLYCAPHLTAVPEEGNLCPECYPERY
jgi:hypothetical protein